MQQLLSELDRNEKVKVITLVLTNGTDTKLKLPNLDYFIDKDFVVVMYSNSTEYIPYNSIVKVATTISQ